MKRREGYEDEDEYGDDGDGAGLTMMKMMEAFVTGGGSGRAHAYYACDGIDLLSSLLLLSAVRSSRCSCHPSCYCCCYCCLRRASAVAALDTFAET